MNKPAEVVTLFVKILGSKFLTKINCNLFVFANHYCVCLVIVLGKFSPEANFYAGYTSLDFKFELTGNTRDLVADDWKQVQTSVQ